MAKRIAGLNVVDPSVTGLDPEPFKQCVRGSRRQVDRKQLAGGYATLVAHKGKLVHADCYTASDATGVPIGHDTMMRLFSMCKTYTAVAVMALCDDGRISLDDPVGEYLPSWSDMRVGASKVPASPQPTIRHCITHTCGLGALTMPKENPPGSSSERMYARIMRSIDAGKITSLGKFVDALAKLPLKTHPGVTWDYGLGFDVAARVIEVASGMSFNDFLQRRLFRPLKMLDTGFHVPKSKAARIGKLYRTRGKKFQVQEPRPGRAGVSDWVSARPPAICCGGGMLGDDRRRSRGLVSTAEDTLRFCLMLRNGGVSRETGKQVLKAKSVNLLTINWLPMKEVCGVPHIKNNFSWGKGLGFSPLGQVGVHHPKKDNWALTVGLNKCENLDREIGHGGWAVTYWSFDPVEDLRMVYFTQHPDMQWRSTADVFKACRQAVTPVSARLKASNASSKGKKRKRESSVKRRAVVARR